MPDPQATLQELTLEMSDVASRLKYDTDEARRRALLERFRDLLRQVDKLIEKEDLARR